MKVPNPQKVAHVSNMQMSYIFVHQTAYLQHIFICILTIIGNFSPYFLLHIKLPCNLLILLPLLNYLYI